MPLRSLGPTALHAEKNFQFGLLDLCGAGAPGPHGDWKVPPGDHEDILKDCHPEDPRRRAGRARECEADVMIRPSDTEPLDGIYPGMLRWFVSRRCVSMECWACVRGLVE